MNKKQLAIAYTLVLIVGFTNTATAQEETGSQEDIQERVEKRLEQASNRLKAYIGTVTDKTEDTIQLENDNNEIKLNSVNEDTTYARTNGSSETIEFDDIGIGDYVISMGSIDENEVLSAQRVVVSSAPREIQSEAFLAEVVEYENDIVVELLQDETTLTLDLNSGYSVTELDEDGEMVQLRISAVDEGDKLIIIGTSSEEVFETDRIHITEQAPEEE